MTNDNLAKLQQLNADLMDFNSVLAGNITNAQNVNKTNAANQQMVADTNAANLAIAEKTNAMNSAINQRNIAFQQAENDITRQREDNAVQRRAADLVRAGLSKTLAAGDAASANALQAPQANIAMQTGHRMESSRNMAYQVDPYTGFGNAMRANRQLEISDRALDIQEDQLAIERDRLQHTKEYDQAVLDENERYHNLLDEWEKDKLDQNSNFHEDAMRLDWAAQELKEKQYLTDKEYKEMENTWLRFQIYSGNKKLTAELAEMAARTVSYLSDAQLSREQIAYVKANAGYVAQLTANALVEQGILKVQHVDAFVSAMTKIYNLSVARGEGTTTTSSIPGKTVQMENARARHTDLARTGITAGATVLTVGAGILLKGGANKVKKKLYDELYHDRFLY